MTIHEATPPFFIVGCARSGTTLLRTMLDNHPDVAIPVESLFIIDYLRVREQVNLERVKKLILKEFEFREWQVSISQDELDQFNTVGEIIRYLHEVYVKSREKRFWGQKTPRFIRHGLLLKEVYPDARFIHIRRDPRAVANSLQNSNVHSSNHYFGAKRWLRDVTAGQDLKRDLPDDVLEISYEQLVSDPQATLREVTQFLNLSYTDTMLEQRKSSSDEYSGYFSGIHSNLSKSLQKDRIDAWRDVLTPQQIAMIESICSPLMQEVDYSPEFLDVEVDDALIQSYRRDRMVRGIPGQIRQYLNGRTYHLFYSIWRKQRLGLLWHDFRDINY